MANDLDALMIPLPEDVVVWRGIRNADLAFGGTSRDDLESIVGTPLEQQRFVGTLLSKDVAENEFTRPGRAPVLMKITARAGAPALWVPPLGSDDTTCQQELLFAPGIVMRILRVDRTYSVPMVEVEVSDGG